MQTFLPVPSFEDSSKILDYRRLGKQRVEGLMILRILSGQKSRWINHPAVKMWVGHEKVLQNYTMIMCNEWAERGYKNTIIPEILSFKFDTISYDGVSWIGDKDFHISHQSNLVRKFPEHYRTFFPDVPDNLPYIWPRK